MNFSRISFLASDAPAAKRALRALAKRYGNVHADTADVLVALGGDGIMLQALHGCMKSGLPVYGMNRGSVGFLMNDYREADLPERLAAAERNWIRPLRMTARTHDGKKHERIAFNEVSFLRQRFMPFSESEMGGFYADKYIAIVEDQGAFCYLTARTLRARTIVEFGTSFGLSMLWLAAPSAPMGPAFPSTQVYAVRTPLQPVGIVTAPIPHPPRSAA